MWLVFLAARVHHWFAVHRSFSWKLLSVLLPPTCTAALVIPFQMQDFPFAFAELHDVPFKPVHLSSLFGSLWGWCALQSIKYTCPRAVPFCLWTCRECTPSCHPTHWYKHWTVLASVPLRDTTNNWPPVGPCITEHSPLSLAVRPVFHRPYSSLTQFAHQFGCKNKVGNCVKGLAQWKINNIHSSCPTEHLSKWDMRTSARPDGKHPRTGSCPLKALCIWVTTLHTAQPFLLTFPACFS